MLGFRLVDEDCTYDVFVLPALAFDLLDRHFFCSLVALSVPNNLWQRCVPIVHVRANTFICFLVCFNLELEVLHFVHVKLPIELVKHAHVFAKCCILAVDIPVVVLSGSLPGLAGERAVLDNIWMFVGFWTLREHSRMRGR